MLTPPMAPPIVWMAKCRAATLEFPFLTVPAIPPHTVVYLNPLLRMLEGVPVGVLVGVGGLRLWPGLGCPPNPPAWLCASRRRRRRARGQRL